MVRSRRRRSESEGQAESPGAPNQHGSSSVPDRKSKKLLIGIMYRPGAAFWLAGRCHMLGSLLRFLSRYSELARFGMGSMFIRVVAYVLALIAMDGPVEARQLPSLSRKMPTGEGRLPRSGIISPIHPLQTQPVKRNSPARIRRVPAHAWASLPPGGVRAPGRSE